MGLGTVSTVVAIAGITAGIETTVPFRWKMKKRDESPGIWAMPMGAENLRAPNAGTNCTGTGVVDGRAGAARFGAAGRVSSPYGEGMGTDPPDPPLPLPLPPLPPPLLLPVTSPPPQAAKMEARIPRGRRRVRV